MRMHVFARPLAALLATGALLIALAPAASAAPLKDADGAPTITTSSPTGYYVWHNDDGWHLRTHGPAAEHDFDAVLRTNGTFENVDPVRLEAGDRVDVLDGGHKLAIHFHTFDFTDGVNFTIRDGEKLRLKLKLDDKRAPTDQIFLGVRGRHPKHNPFTIKL
jgi:hypothetical protein